MKSEMQLIAELKSGHAEALKDIMRLYSDYVYTLLLQMVKKRHVAEELTQDVFVKLYHKISDFKGTSRFSTWLYTITYRTGLNHLQKKSLTHSFSDFTEEEQHHIFNNGTVVPDGLKQKEQKEIIWQAVDKLKQPYGIIITLFYLQEMTVGEIANMMGSPQNSIKTYLFRGRKMLYKHLITRYKMDELV